MATEEAAPPKLSLTLSVPEKIPPIVLLKTHLTPAISSPVNIAAPCLWREMDNFARRPPYVNCRKNLLRNRHKMGGTYA